MGPVQNLRPLDQLASQQPQSLADIVSDPAIWIGYSPLTVILLLVLRLMGIRLWNSTIGSLLITAICVLYAAQQRLLLGRQELLAVRRTKQAVAAAGEQTQDGNGSADVKEMPASQIMLTLLGAEIADHFSAGQMPCIAFMQNCSASNYLDTHAMHSIIVLESNRTVCFCHWK